MEKLKVIPKKVKVEVADNGIQTCRICRIQFKQGEPYSLIVSARIGEKQDYISLYTDDRPQPHKLLDLL